MSLGSIGFGKYALTKRCWYYYTKEFGLTLYIRIGKLGHMFGYNKPRREVYRMSMKVA